MGGAARTIRARNFAYHGSAARGTRPAALGLAKVLFLGASQISLAGAAPLKGWLHGGREDLPEDPSDPSLWIYLTVATILVLAGGAFAGLTIA
jgi:metal transporter CNNM